MTTLDEFLARSTPQVRELALSARALVRDMLPETVEQVQPGRNAIAFGVGEKMSEQVCYIAPFKSYVNLGFYKGAELPDPDGLLEGTGKLLRHMKVKRLEDLERPGVRRLLLAAMERA
jgi:hypothetical protein